MINKAEVISYRWELHPALSTVPEQALLTVLEPVWLLLEPLLEPPQVQEPVLPLEQVQAYWLEQQRRLYIPSR